MTAAGVSGASLTSTHQWSLAMQLDTQQAFLHLYAQPCACNSRAVLAEHCRLSQQFKDSVLVLSPDARGSEDV
jgi:hypothetical protein